MTWISRLGKLSNKMLKNYFYSKIRKNVFLQVGEYDGDPNHI